MGGGILPVAFRNNHPYFLFSREALIARKDAGKRHFAKVGKKATEF